jgi:serine/threonine-protein kinase
MPELRDQLQRALETSYAIEHELGGGGMSRVFVAVERALERRVVIKVLSPELSAAVNADRFRREILVAAGLQHPHIVPVLIAGEAAGLLYFTMPFVHGESLGSLLAREGALPVARAVSLARELADALAHAHDRGVIHRDVKPANVLLSGGHAMVTDFGIAKALDDPSGERGTLTSTGMALGTPAYMAPEQVAADPAIDHRCDLYALGVVLYEMLAGAPPFSGTSRALLSAQVSAEPPPLSSRRRDVPAELATLVARCLAKAPEERPASAAAVAGELEEIGTRLPRPTRDSSRLGARRSLVSSWRGRAIIAASAGAAVIATALGLTQLRSAKTTLDADLIAVAPFDALGADLQLWHEGLVDLLSRKLDGAGPLRTVSPTVVIGRWSGRADPTSAAALGHATGARLAVFGNVVASGGDSVVLSASVFDVAARRLLGSEIELRGAAERMDRLTDSLAVALLRELARTRQVTVGPPGSLRAASFPALKAFLQGEQEFRRGDWPVAQATFERAATLDSGFALAWRRAGNARWWSPRGGYGDPVAAEYLTRAGSLNRGLTRRDSLLVAADSIMAAVTMGYRNRDLLRRLHGTLDVAVTQHPDDPEAWYMRAEASHFSDVGLATRAEGLVAFERSFELDPKWAALYPELVGLALRFRDVATARRYAERGVALLPTSDVTHGALLVVNLVDPRTASTFDRRILDTVPVATLRGARLTAFVLVDSAEAGITIARAMVARAREVDAAGDLSSSGYLMSELARRGHLREAQRVPQDTSFTFSHLRILLGIGALESVPSERVESLVPQSMSSFPAYTRLALLPRWAARHDTAQIRAFLADSGRLMNQIAVDDSLWLPMLSRAGRGFLALARGDSAVAATNFASLPNICGTSCKELKLVAARVLANARREREAERLLERGSPAVYEGYDVWAGLWELERGRLAEQLGNRARAAEAYRFVVDVWRHADPSLQAYVAEARAALRRLDQD